MVNYGTRTDCIRDNKRVRLPHASFPDSNFAKRGYWVRYQPHAGDNCLESGRVVGRVVCEGEIYVELINLLGFVRWVKPVQIMACAYNPPWQTLRFLTGKWSNPDYILRRAAQGFAFNNGPDGKPITKAKARRRAQEFHARHPELLD